MPLTITFNDEEANAIASLVPRMKTGGGMPVTSEKEVLLIGLSILLKSQGCYIRPIPFHGHYSEQFNVWR